MNCVAGEMPSECRTLPLGHSVNSPDMKVMFVYGQIPVAQGCLSALNVPGIPQWGLYGFWRLLSDVHWLRSVEQKYSKHKWKHDAKMVSAVLSIPLSVHTSH